MMNDWKDEVTKCHLSCDEQQPSKSSSVIVQWWCWSSKYSSKHPSRILLENMLALTKYEPAGTEDASKLRSRVSLFSLYLF